jgi:hypothetical protein
MTRLRAPNGINARFVAYQLHFLWMMGYFQHRCTHHVNQASVSSSTLADTVPLIVAPTMEQGRIVAEIEKQFTRLDAAVAALKRVQANLKRYRASVLKAAWSPPKPNSPAAKAAPTNPPPSFSNASSLSAATAGRVLKIRHRNPITRSQFRPKYLSFVSCRKDGPGQRQNKSGIYNSGDKGPLGITQADTCALTCE